MKTIQVFRTKYGVDGWVNGKLRYNGDSDSIDLSKVKRVSSVICRNDFGTMGIKYPGANYWFTTTLTGTFDTGILATESYFPKILWSISRVMRTHWRDIITVTGSISAIYTLLDQLGIFSYRR